MVSTETPGPPILAAETETCVAVAGVSVRAHRVTRPATRRAFPQIVQGIEARPAPVSDHDDCQPAGPILDAMDVRLAMDATDRVVEVLILAKTVDMETGEIGLTVASNDLDWIAQAGLVAAYGQVQSSPERDG